MTRTEKMDRIYRTANELYETEPKWPTFFREILGLNGMVRRMFPTRQALDRFEQTETYQDILRMLTKLRQRRDKPTEQTEQSEQAERSEKSEQAEMDEKSEQAEMDEDLEAYEESRQTEETEKTEQVEPTRVVTVRLPKSLHESLRVEAFEHHTSMNKLCISKLLQIIDDELVPADA